MAEGRHDIIETCFDIAPLSDRARIGELTNAFAFY
jgi:hypothetical protein